MAVQNNNMDLLMNCISTPFLMVCVKLILPNSCFSLTVPFFFKKLSPKEDCTQMEAFTP